MDLPTCLPLSHGKFRPLNHPHLGFLAAKTFLFQGETTLDPIRLGDYASRTWDLIHSGYRQQY